MLHVNIIFHILQMKANSNICKYLWEKLPQVLVTKILLKSY